MQDIPNASPLMDVHFPQRTNLIKKLRYVSFAINDIILVISFFVIIVWIIDIPIVGNFIFYKLATSPFATVLFILCGTSLFFGAKRHLMSNQHDDKNYPWWNTWIPISLAVLTAVLGFVNFTQLNSTGILSFFRVSVFGGMCFFLLGLALIPPFTRILHRFHITQFFIFIVSGLNVFIVLESMFQLFSPFPTQNIISIPLPTALTFILFCFGLLLRWSNRGFFGNLTLDSTGSTFAFRLFLINLIAAPLIALVILLLMPSTFYNMYQILTVIVIFFTFTSCFLLWINVKLMYRYELEHLLMRESLRSHNIDLAADKEELRKKMIQIEQEKQQYLDKLNTQKRWQDTADSLG